MRRFILWLAGLGVLASAAAFAEPPEKSVYVIAAATANPSIGTIETTAAHSLTCTVMADANAHAVTVYVAGVKPDGVVSDFVEWTTAAGTATAGTPYVFVLPYRFDRVRISVANAGADTITAWCTPWAG